MLKFSTEKIAWTNSLDIICGEIFRYSSLPLFLLHLCSCLWLWRLSGNPIWICWGRPQWLMHPGHTLIPADLRVFFFHPEVERVMEALPCQMFGDQTSSCVSSCRRLWWSHWFSRARVRPGVFQDTSRGKKKQRINRGNRITPPLQTPARSLHAAPIKAKTPGRDLEPLNVFDGRWVFPAWF